MLRGRASGSFSAGRKKRVKQGWLKIKRVQKSRKPKGNEWWKKKQKRERERGREEEEKREESRNGTRGCDGGSLAALGLDAL